MSIVSISNGDYSGTERLGRRWLSLRQTPKSVREREVKGNNTQLSPTRLFPQMALQTHGKQPSTAKTGISSTCFIVLLTMLFISPALEEKTTAAASPVKSESSPAKPDSSQLKGLATTLLPQTSPKETASKQQARLATSAGSETPPAGNEPVHPSRNPTPAELHQAPLELAMALTQHTGYSVSTEASQSSSTSSSEFQTIQTSTTSSMTPPNYWTSPTLFPETSTLTAFSPSVSPRKQTSLSRTSEILTEKTPAAAASTSTERTATSLDCKSEEPSNFNHPATSDGFFPTTSPKENAWSNSSTSVACNVSCEPVDRFITGMAGVVDWVGPREGCHASWIYHINVPESYGIVAKLQHVELKADFFIEFQGIMKGPHFEYGVTYRNISLQNSLNGFDPIIVYERELRIIINTPEPPYGEHLAKLTVSFRAQLLASMPARIFVEDGAPRESRRLYDCSAGYGVHIPEELMCNKIEQCAGGEDEVNCEYRQDGCGDWIPYGEKCLKITFALRTRAIPGHHHVTMPREAEAKCRSEHEAGLATLPDAEGINMVTDMIRQSGFTSAAIGIRKFKPSSPKLTHLYKYIWQWGGVGGPLAYEQQRLQRDKPLLGCGMLSVFPMPRIVPIACVLPAKIPTGYVCMKTNAIHSNPEPPLARTKLTFFNATVSPPENLSFKQCLDGSFVQTFHPCKWGEEVASTPVDKFPFFHCRFGPPVHYTLVCDGVEDCADGSDEIACAEPRFPPIKETSFVCQTFQLVALSQRCNGVPDCMDGSDENYCSSCGKYMSMCPGVGCVPVTSAESFDTCPLMGAYSSPRPYLHRPAVLILDGFGWFRLQPTDDNCTEGHFKCHEGLCIPSYLLNNGEMDCLHGDDENIAEESMTCPGYYRCQDFGMCVHPELLCDGIHHCPNKDDEKYCNVSCPGNCTCQGYAYSCRATFNPFNHTQVRYLDLSRAENPGPFLQYVHVLEFLRFLNLSRCGLRSVALRDMPQLNVLDLSHNHLKSLPSFNLSGLSGVTWLDLSGNPFVSVIDSTFVMFVRFASLTRLEMLALTGTDLVSIEDRALSSLTRLATLDLRSNRLEKYGSGIFWGLRDLQVLQTDDQKLCCQYFHRTPLQRCYAPADELSSCKDLLQSDFFRVFLWLLAVLAITGNAGVLIYRLRANELKTPPAFRVLVKNLCASDFLMGVYMLMIGAADAKFRNRYVEEESEWRQSATCKVAGVLAFLSSEVSAFVICLITLDRLLVICCPLKVRLHLGSRSAIIMCCCVWATCLVLAVVPLIVGLQFYGQNGICLPLPITRRRFSGQRYAFAIFIVLNFLLFVLIGGGQVAIYRAVREAGAAAGTQCSMQMTLARRLFLVVFTDFCCWFPIGVMGLLAASGTAIPGEVNVWAAIFVMPLNSALNPFLYTLNGVLERWERRRLEVRTTRMLRRLQTEIPKWQPATVAEMVRISIRSKLVKREKVLQWLGPAQDTEERPEWKAESGQIPVTTQEGIFTSDDVTHGETDVTVSVEMSTSVDVTPGKNDVTAGMVLSMSGDAVSDQDTALSTLMELRLLTAEK